MNPTVYYLVIVNVYGPNRDIFYSMPRGEPLNFAGYKNGHLDGCRKGFYTACGNWLVYLRIDDLLLLDPFSGATMTLPPPDTFHDTDMSEKLFIDVRYSQVIKLMVCSPNLIESLLYCSKVRNPIGLQCAGQEAPCGQFQGTCLCGLLTWLSTKGSSTLLTIMSTSWLWTSAWMTILVIQADLVEDALPG
jgi:hypothetical protein